MCLSKQASCFKITSKFIMNHPQEKFDSSRDVADALKMLNDLDTDEWRPTMSVITAEEEAARDRENREFDID